MTELEIIIKDLRKDMTPEETSELDKRKANFFKNLDAKYPGIYNAYLEMIKEESESEPEPEIENIDEIIDEFLDFLNDLLTVEDDEIDEADEKLEDDEEEPEFDFERIEFHDPATIVFWTDGTKTVVKARHGDKFDKEKGLAMAIAKKVMGNTNKYYDVFEEYCLDEDASEENESLHDVMERFGIAPPETYAGNEEEFDLDANSTNEEETVAEPIDESKPVEDNQPKKQGSKRGKKQD